MELAEVKKEEGKFIKLVKWVLSSLDNHSTGSSGKKWTALTIVICIVAMHVSWLRNAHSINNYELLPTILMTDFSFISLLFGINVTDKKLNGNTTLTATQGKIPGGTITEIENKTS